MKAKIYYLLLFAMIFATTLCATAQDRSWMNPFVFDYRLNQRDPCYKPDSYMKPKGNVKEVLTTEIDNFGARYTLNRYDKNGRLVCHIVKSRSNENFYDHIIEIEFYKYDTKGRIVGICAFGGGPSDWSEEDENLTVYEYNEEKQIVRCEKYMILGSPSLWGKEESFSGLGFNITTFDEAIAVARKEQKTLIDEYRIVNKMMPDGRLWVRTIYGKVNSFSDDDSLNTRLDTFTVVNKKASRMITSTIKHSTFYPTDPFTVDTIFYDDARKQVKSIQHHGWQERTTEYAIDGHKTSYTYSYDNFICKREYNADGDEVHLTAYNQRGLTQEIRYEYSSYDSQGNWTKCDSKEYHYSTCPTCETKRHYTRNIKYNY